MKRVMLTEFSSFPSGDIIITILISRNSCTLLYLGSVSNTLIGLFLKWTTEILYSGSDNIYQVFRI